MSCFCQTSQSGHGFTLQINSLWPSDAMWRHNSGSTFAQVMTCCLTAPSHYLDQYWLLICEVVLHPTEGNFTANVQATILYNEFENCTFEISQGEWVNCVAAQIQCKLEDCNWVDDKLHYIFKRYHVECILRWDWPEHWRFDSRWFESLVKLPLMDVIGFYIRKKNNFKNHFSKIAFQSPMDQWVKWCLVCLVP